MNQLAYVDPPAGGRVASPRPAGLTVSHRPSDLSIVHREDTGRRDLEHYVHQRYRVLRRAWHFDGSDRVPSEAQVKGLLRYVGWDKVRWKRPHIVLPKGMEIDLGGIGKEYAVDRALLRLSERHRSSVLVNFGGDLRVSGPRQGCQPWVVGVEHSRGGKASPLIVEIYEGAMATSGDAHRFLVKDGQRYGHILDPRTGWPIEHAPRSVTIASTTCTEAGIFATLGLLHGAQAERFLEQQGGRYWCIR